MKIVLDTTILVRANEHTQGLARELLLHIVESEHQLLLSNEMLYELARVLRYRRLREFYDFSEELVFNYVGFLRESAKIITLNPVVRAPIRDAQDVMIMQTAIIGEADVLCTGDDDFFDPLAADYLANLGIAVMGDIALMHRLRS